MSEINKADFPSNSKRPKNVAPISSDNSVAMNIPPQQQPNKKVEKVITGQVIQRKKTFGDKITQTFFGDDAKSVASYILWDVLIPAAKNTISEMVSSGIEMLLFGETKGSLTRRERGKSFVSYSSMYNRDRDRIHVRDVGSESSYYRNRASHRFNDIVIESRGEAEEVLSGLVDQIEQYGVASIADFYDLVGMATEFTDNKYGWTNLNRATVDRVREGYILVLPKPVELD